MQNDSECQSNRHPTVPGGCLTGKETIDDGEAQKGVAENGGLGFGAGLGVGTFFFFFFFRHTISTDFVQSYRVLDTS